MQISVNGRPEKVQASPETPLLYVLCDELGLTSPQFGCGLAQCGACSVLVDNREIRSCVVPISAAQGKEVVTVEGLARRWAPRTPPKQSSSAEMLHPVQEAWIEQQTPLCGICQSGMMIKAVELLEQVPKPSDDQIRAAFTTSGPSPHLCRCGTYTAILQSVRRAAEIMERKKL